VGDVGEVGNLEENRHGMDEVRSLKPEALFYTSGATTTAPGLITGRPDLS
jgi:hypothetical protein